MPELVYCQKPEKRYGEYQSVRQKSGCDRYTLECEERCTALPCFHSADEEQRRCYRCRHQGQKEEQDMQPVAVPVYTNLRRNKLWG